MQRPQRPMTKPGAASLGGQRRHWRRAAALVTTGAVATIGLSLAAVPTAQANGNCGDYWSAVTGTWSGTPAAGGTGTPEDPYQVGSQTDLSEIEFCRSSHFTQIADIGLVGEWTPVTGISGSFDGQNHTIDGLTITGQADSGLFGALDGEASVVDLHLTNVNINAPAEANIGALAALSSGGSSVSGITVSGQVIGGEVVGGVIGSAEYTEISDVTSGVDVVAASGDHAGALVGSAFATSISDSTTSGSLSGLAAVGGLVGTVDRSSIETSSATGSATGTTQIGGLVGNALNGTPAITDSFSSGDVTATGGTAGGILGENNTDRTIIANVYQSGAVTASTTSGGIVGGGSQDPASVTESFWSSTANPSISGGPGTPKTQSQLRDISTFTSANWPIQLGAPATDGNLWGICSPADESVNAGYPFLQWNNSSDPCPAAPAPPTPPTPADEPQTAANNCVTAGNSKNAISPRGSKRLMRAGCITNAGKRIGVRVKANLRGDATYYRLTCKVSGKNARSTKLGASGHYCKKGKLKVRTYGAKLRLRVTWSAKAAAGFEAYKKVKTYKT